MFIYKQKYNNQVYTWQQSEAVDTVTEKIEDLASLYNQLDVKNERLVVLGFGREEDLNLFLGDTVEVYQLVPRAHKYIGNVDIKKVYDNFYNFLEELAEHNFTSLEGGGH